MFGSGHFRCAGLAGTGLERLATSERMLSWYLTSRTVSAGSCQAGWVWHESKARQSLGSPRIGGLAPVRVGEVTRPSEIRMWRSASQTVRVSGPQSLLDRKHIPCHTAALYH